jgi:putative membrane protein
MDFLLLMDLQAQTGLTGTIIRIIITAGALFTGAWLLKGVTFRDFGQAILGAVVLAVLNATVGRVLDFLSIPFTVITLGLFSLVVDAVILWLTSRILQGFEISSAWYAFLLAVLMAIFNVFLHAIYL